MSNSSSKRSNKSWTWSYFTKAEENGIFKTKCNIFSKEKVGQMKGGLGCSGSGKSKETKNMIVSCCLKPQGEGGGMTVCSRVCVYVCMFNCSTPPCSGY